jgi:hypothetical protein
MEHEKGRQQQRRQRRRAEPQPLPQHDQYGAADLDGDRDDMEQPPRSGRASARERLAALGVKDPGQAGTKKHQPQQNASADPKPVTVQDLPDALMHARNSKRQQGSPFPWCGWAKGHKARSDPGLAEQRVRHCKT